MNFLEGMIRSSGNRMVDIHLLRSYLNYMVNDMDYKPSTVNVRLRNLKRTLDGFIERSILMMTFPLD